MGVKSLRKVDTSLLRVIQRNN